MISVKRPSGPREGKIKSPRERKNQLFIYFSPPKKKGDRSIVPLFERAAGTMWLPHQTDNERGKREICKS